MTTRLAEARSGSLVVNRYHNGYPDLIPPGHYPNDSVQRGVGLEVKASRSEGSWQAHGPRTGWFIVVQFQLDENDGVARLEREPTRIQAAMVADLSSDDWSWTPARAGRIRSGTASIKPAGRLKLREGAVWLDPQYRSRHESLLRALVLSEYRRNSPRHVLETLQLNGDGMSAAEIAAAMPQDARISNAEVLAAVRAAIAKLRRDGAIVSAGRRGRYVGAGGGGE